MAAPDRLDHLRRTARDVKTLRSVLRQATASERLGPDHGIDVDSLRSIVDLWDFLLSNPAVQSTYAEAPLSEPDAHWLTPEILDAVDAEVRDARQYLNSLRALAFLESVIRHLMGWMEEVLKRGNALPPNDEESRRALEFAHGGLQTLVQRRSWQVLKQVELAADSAAASATTASEAAGNAGENAMATHFDALAKEEVAAAGRFRRWTIGMMIVGGLVAGVLLLAPALGWPALAIEAGDYVHLTQRVIVTAAVFGLAGYFARQAAHHRTTANWARALAVQLKTFDAFIDPVASREVKEALRTKFAERVFGEPPAAKGDVSDLSPSPLAEKVLDLLSRGKSS